MQYQTPIDFRAARDFGGVMNMTYRFIRENIKGLGKSLLFFAAPAVLLASVFYHEIVTRMLKLSTSPYDSSPFGVDEYFTSINFWISLLAALVFMLIGGVFTVTTTHAYILKYREKPDAPVDLGEVWKKSRSLFWKTFGAMFLYHVGASMALGMLMIPVAILIVVTNMISPLLSGLSMLLYYAALFILCIYFAMIFFICNKEGIGFFAGLSRLTKLTKGKFWSTVGVGAINVYIQIVFSALFMIPWYVFLFLYQLHDVATLFGHTASSPSFWHEAIGTVLFMINMLAGTLLSALPLTALAVQYYSLSERQESRGLLSRIENFGQQLQVASQHEDY
jgi:hypothetical protein